MTKESYGDSGEGSYAKIYLSIQATQTVTKMRQAGEPVEVDTTCLSLAIKVAGGFCTQGNFSFATVSTSWLFSTGGLSRQSEVAFWPNSSLLSDTFHSRSDITATSFQAGWTSNKQDGFTLRCIFP